MLVRRLALAAAGLTLVLIVAGGLVTNTDSGLACPDWPTCFGSPFPKMVGGVLVEHTHRLIAGLVGFLSVLLALLLLKRDAMPRFGWLLSLLFAPLVLIGAFWAAAVVAKTGVMPALPAAFALSGFAGCLATLARARGEARLAVGAVILVLAQGLLGGATVVYRLPPTILVAHLGTSMLFFSTLLVLAFRLNAPALSTPAQAPRGLLWLTTGAVYFQILLGATVRHTGSGLVCVDFPLCHGALWPTGVHPAFHLHMAHRAFALAVTALVMLVSARLWRAPDPASRRLARAAPALVVLQIALGILTIVTFKELLSVTGHLLVGALLLSTFVSLLVRTWPAESTATALGAAERRPSLAQASS